MGFLNVDRSVGKAIAVPLNFYTSFLHYKVLCSIKVFEILSRLVKRYGKKNKAIYKMERFEKSMECMFKKFLYNISKNKEAFILSEKMLFILGNYILSAGNEINTGDKRIRFCRCKAPVIKRAQKFYRIINTTKSKKICV